MERSATTVEKSTVVAALNEGDIERAVELLRIDQAILFPLADAVRGAFIFGGQSALGEQGRGLSGRFSFDGRHARAERWIDQHVGALIQGIQDEQVEMTRTVISEGLQNGRGSAAIAREIVGRKVGQKRVGGFLGLTSEITDSIIRGRARLLSGDPSELRKYLKLRLRDKRYDRQIRGAIKKGKPITGRSLDTIMEAHRSKALGYRGWVVAKNESHTALAAGRDESYRQMLENPEVEKVTVRWQHNLSTEPRLEHLEMDGTVIEMGETFSFPDVEMKHPHDPAGGAKHSIGCRCIGIYRVRFRRD